MMIDKVSGINQINNLQSTKRTSSASNVKASDQISVSEEAKAMAEAYKLEQIAKETPDIREDLVEAIKQKIQDPNYLNEATLFATADKILSAYGL
jgi:negative regulator of flagellin synthesis FlgM